jgi:hypothetical protein
VTYRWVFDWMIGFIDTLYTPLGTTRNYSAIATSALYNSRTSFLSLLQSPLVVFWQRIHNSLIKLKSFTKSSLQSLIPFLPLLSITYDCRHSQFSASTVISRTSLSSHPSCVRSPLYSLGADSQETPLPLVLGVDSLLQGCLYRTAVWQRPRHGPTKNAVSNTSSIVTYVTCSSAAYVRTIT